MSRSSDMMLSRAGTGRIPLRKLGLVAVEVVTCLLLPRVFLATLNSNLDPFSIYTKGVQLPHISEENQESENSMANTKGVQLPHISEENQELENSVTKENQAPENSVASNLVPESKLSCDLSQRRSDTCIIHGDVRILDHSSASIVLASPLQLAAKWKIRPFGRKWEPTVMRTIKELTLRSMNSVEAPRCTVNHSVPAVVFSTGGFLGNIFHDFTNVLIPLFITSRQYQREVQFMVTDFNSRLIDKYRSILNQLTRYEIINLDRESKVHCFPKVHVGLISNKELGVDPSKSPNGYTIADFREMLRASFSLKRKVIRTGNSNRPRLLILLRKGSRSFMNNSEVVGLGRSLGFKVVVAGSEETKNVSRFARIVNSCDVMMGVHGAGLTNMVFLPTGGTLIQIVPWGGLKWACWHDYGEPTPDMGVKYLEYEIREEESSLIQQYPRDHPVFTDPLSIHKQGWDTLWSVFLDKQKVKLDVRRFKPILIDALQSVH